MLKSQNAGSARWLISVRTGEYIIANDEGELFYEHDMASTQIAEFNTPIKVCFRL